MSRRAAQGVLLGGLLVALPLWYALAATEAGLAFIKQVPPAFVLLVGMLFAVCAWAGDPWAAALVAYLLGRALVFPLQGGFDQAMSCVMGFGVYGCARTVKPDWRARLRVLVVIVGVVESLWSCANAGGIPGVSWYAWAGGTLGNPNYAGAFLSLAAAWAPWWLLPLFGAGIIATKSALAALAFCAMLMVRFRPSRWIMLGIGLVGAGVWWWRGVEVFSWLLRAALWRWGLTQWLLHAPIWGFGPGAWAVAKPQVVLHHGGTVTPWDRQMPQAHNELVQLAFEGGLIALCLLAGWLWTYQRALRRPSHVGFVAALCIESLGMFPFHIVAVAVLALVGLGFATGGDP